MVDPILAAKVLAWLNAEERTADEIVARVRDDPGFGTGSPRAYGVRRTLAERILQERDRKPERRFRSIEEVDAVFRMGPDTLHDLLWSLSFDVLALPAQAVNRFRNARRVLVICGAGVSAASGIPTHRAERWIDETPLTSSQKGLFPGRAPDLRSELTATQLEALSKPDAFASDIQLVWEWLMYRRDRAAAVRPNTTHMELRRMVGHYRGDRRATIVTQCQDGLLADELARARLSDRLVEIHGSLLRARCVRCGHAFPTPPTPRALPRPEDEDYVRPFYVECPTPRCRGVARPEVLWLTEHYGDVLSAAGAEAARAEAVLVIGTSGAVRPPIWLALEARFRNSAYVLEASDDAADTPITRYVDHRVVATAEATLFALASAVGWA